MTSRRTRPPSASSNGRDAERDRDAAQEDAQFRRPRSRSPPRHAAPVFRGPRGRSRRAGCHRRARPPASPTACRSARAARVASVRCADDRRRSSRAVTVVAPTGIETSRRARADAAEVTTTSRAPTRASPIALGERAVRIAAWTSLVLALANGCSRTTTSRSLPPNTSTARTPAADRSSSATRSTRVAAILAGKCEECARASRRPRPVGRVIDASRGSRARSGRQLRREARGLQLDVGAAAEADHERRGIRGDFARGCR